MKLFALSIAAAAAALTQVSGYKIKDIDSLACRDSTAMRTSVIVKSYSKEECIDVVCKLNGTPVNGDPVWLKTNAGCLVSNYYINTGDKLSTILDCPSSTA
ncbi:hypothetical protein GGI12_004909 [Dipsacomyces acuminosporus]|nr:hypothetical protein GGI12_004909 [Dipsacomyces acuminosporus]